MKLGGDLSLRKNKEELYLSNLDKLYDIALPVYQKKASKNKLIFITNVQNISIFDYAKKTPETVSFFNKTEYRVNIVNQMAKKYTVRTGTRR